MSVRRVLTAFLLAVSVAVAPIALAAPAAEAADPVQLGPGHVVDQAGVLSKADVDTIEAATATLKKNHQITLYVVFVDHFTNPTDAEDWANETAARNDLGPTDYLLAAETDGSAYYLSGDDSGPVSDQELTTIEQSQVVPALHAQDWTKAAVAAANGLGDAVGGGPAPWLVWLLVVVLVAIAAVAFLLIRRRRTSRTRKAPTP